MNPHPSTDLSAISKFPIFSKYNYLMKHEIQLLTKNLPPYADFSIQVMELWFNANNDLELSNVHGNILFSFTDLLDANLLKYYFGGLANVNDSINLIKESGSINKLSCVPRETIDSLDVENKLQIHEDRDSFEYLLCVEEQINLTGSKFGKYRRKVNTLIDQIGASIETVQLDLNDGKNRAKLIQLHSAWETRNDPEGNEIRAIQQALNRHKELGYNCLVITVDGEIHGFTLYFIHTDGRTANISHTKSSYKYDNLFDYIVHSTARQLQKRGVDRMNFEMDLGIPGLRMHKMGLRPCSFFEKFTIDFS